MSGLGTILIIVGFIVQYLFDSNKKKEKSPNKKPQKKIQTNKQIANKVKTNKKNVVPKKNVQAINNFGNAVREVSNKKKRVIVDREQEIFANSEIISKENLVQDIIFAEIINKPKSKRK